MPKHILTDDDFKHNPILKKMGCKPGDEIEIPAENASNDNLGEDTGGGGNHPNKPGNP